MFFAVRAMVRLVRPWYAWSNATTAWRPVACRATLIAFSTASAPEFSSTDRFSCVPGVRRPSSSHTVTYSSYGVTMKQVWVNWATCALTRSTTRGAALPAETTAMPDPKSMSELLSASTRTPPPAAVTNTGSTWLTPRATVRCRRSSSSRDAGPGISVTTRRSWGSPGPPTAGAEPSAESGADAFMLPTLRLTARASHPVPGPRLGWSAYHRKEQPIMADNDRSRGVLFGGVFSRGGVEAGDTAWLRAMLDTEAALARAVERAGLAPAGAGAAVTGNPVPALSRALARQVPRPLAGAVHKGATSQDIVDTPAMLMARRALAVIGADLAT